MSGRFAESAARLSGLVPRLTGWPPGTFWQSTPSELAALLGSNASGEAAPLTRGELEHLMERESDERICR